MPLVSVGRLKGPVRPRSWAKRFDGIADDQRLITGLAGAIDSPKLIISDWMMFDGGDGVVQEILKAGPINFRFYKLANNSLQLICNNAAGVAILNLSSSNAIVAGTSYHHILIAADMGVPGSASLLIDGVNRKIETTFINDIIDFTLNNWTFSGTNAGANRLNGKKSRMYYNFGEYLDFSLTANVRKFRSASGRPVYPGYNGARPTGNQPIGWFPDGGPRNYGYGGDFVVTGKLERVPGP